MTITFARLKNFPNGGLIKGLSQPQPKWLQQGLTHWDRVTHICIANLTIIGSDNGLSPCWCQAIIWTNAGILLIGPWGTNFSEILIIIHTFSFKKMHLKMLSAKWRPFSLGLNMYCMSRTWGIEGCYFINLQHLEHCYLGGNAWLLTEQLFHFILKPLTFSLWLQYCKSVNLLISNLYKPLNKQNIKKLRVLFIMKSAAYLFKILVLVWKYCLSRYTDFYYKDQMVMKSCYIYNPNPYASEMASLYWHCPPDSCFMIFSWSNNNIQNGIGQMLALILACYGIFKPNCFC